MTTVNNSLFIAILRYSLKSTIVLINNIIKIKSSFLLLFCCINYYGFCSLNVNIHQRVYTHIQIEIPISETVADANQIDISIPSCKYGKQFAISFSGDDCLMGIYQRPYQYINGRYVDDKPIFHANCESATTGFTPSRKLVYTDGCGNDIPFRLGINWMDSKIGQNIHQNGNKWMPYMNWNEGSDFLDFYNGLFNHGGGDQTKPVESVVNNHQAIADNLSYNTYILGLPGESTGFDAVGDSLPNVYALLSSRYQLPTQRDLKLSLVDSTYFHKMRIGRWCLDKNYSIDNIKELIDTHAKDSYWVNMFCHDIKNSTTPVVGQLNADICFAFLDYVYDTYGKAGADNVWFASDSEIFEYAYSRSFSKINKRLENGKLVIEIQFAYLPDFYFDEISLVINKNTDVSAIKYSENVETASAVSSEGQTLINLSVSDYTEKKCLKFIQKFEESQLESDKADALFFINRLVTGKKKIYMDKLALADNLPSYQDDSSRICCEHGLLSVNGISKNVKAAIYRLDGTQIKQFILTPYSVEDLSYFPSSLYVLKITDVDSSDVEVYKIKL